MGWSATDYAMQTGLKTVIFLQRGTAYPFRGEFRPFIGDVLANNSKVEVIGEYLKDSMQLVIKQQDMTDSTVFNTINGYLNHGWQVQNTALDDGLLIFTLKRKVSIERASLILEDLPTMGAVALEGSLDEFYSDEFHEIINYFLSKDYWLWTITAKVEYRFRIFIEVGQSSLW